MDFIATNSDSLQTKKIGNVGWGILQLQQAVIFKEEHQTQPIELKCLAHEICDFCCGRMLPQYLLSRKCILNSMANVLVRKSFLPK